MPSNPNINCQKLWKNSPKKSKEKIKNFMTVEIGYSHYSIEIGNIWIIFYFQFFIHPNILYLTKTNPNEIHDFVLVQSEFDVSFLSCVSCSSVTVTSGSYCCYHAEKKTWTKEEKRMEAQQTFYWATGEGSRCDTPEECSAPKKLHSWPVAF